MAVVGVTDPDTGLTTPEAFVVLSTGPGGADVTADLVDQVRVIGGYKVPSEIAFVDALPRTPLMKIDRKALREMSKSPA